MFALTTSPQLALEEETEDAEEQLDTGRTLVFNEVELGSSRVSLDSIVLLPLSS